MKSAYKEQWSKKIDASTFDQRDIWRVEELGFKPDDVQGVYQLNFTRLKPDWFKKAVKRFVRFQSTVKSLASCVSYIGRLTHFSDFIVGTYTDLLSDEIDRSVIIKYLSFLANSNLSVVTRNMAIIHLRTFHNIITQENWLPWPKEPLIYSSDLPKNVDTIPKYIPEYVIAQLQKKSSSLPCLYAKSYYYSFGDGKKNRRSMHPTLELHRE